jgi:hypothetical protein
MVKIQLNVKNYLHMREVQVYNFAGENVALNKTATQSSTMYEGGGLLLTGSAVVGGSNLLAGSAVDGSNTTYSHTLSEQGKYK